jgi:hypothetical protein
MPTRIRFVGGPWHNRLEDIELSPVVLVRRALPQTTLSYGGCFAAAKLKEDEYLLASYETKFGTSYYQYVHSSLVRGGYADRSTYSERLPVWRIDRRQLEARLRRTVGCLAKKRR